MLWAGTHLGNQGAASATSTLSANLVDSMGLSSEDPGSVLTMHTLQAASFVAPIWTVSCLVTAFDLKDTCPISTLELVFTAGCQHRWEKTKGQSQSQCGTRTYAISTPGKNRTSGCP